MARDPVVLIHGYSDEGTSFMAWKRALLERGYALEEVPVVTYKSLTNEVTIKDIAEGFDRALRTRAKLADGQPFNAIVHSTGMLVLRSWLTTYGARRRRLKHLIALAPATFGSPLAHKGRGFLGAIFKGNKVVGPDFLEAGDMILDGLELGSSFTWDLTHKDVLSEDVYYGKGADTPYVFIFCGTSTYSGIRQLVNEPGTDGTVRWAGCSLGTQKIHLDFTRDPAREPTSRVTSSNIAAQGVLDMPFWPIAGKNHATIIKDPGDVLIDLVDRALQVDSEQAFKDWYQTAKAATADAVPKQKWQQFVVRAVDERGDPIKDYHIELSVESPNGEISIDFDLDVHTYRADPSLRCFHVDLTALEEAIEKAGGGALFVRIIASSGTALVGYHGIAGEKVTADGKEVPDGVWDAKIEVPRKIEETGVTVFFPFTTTFVEMSLNRDPRPFGAVANKVCEFLDM
jgi:hypothetical protein